MKNIWSWSCTSGRGARLRRFTNTTPAPRPSHFLSRSSSQDGQRFFSACGERGGGRGPGGGLEASVPPPPSRSGPEALPRPLPRAHRGSYRNSAGLAVSRRPLRGPPGNRDEREGPGVGGAGPRAGEDAPPRPLGTGGVESEEPEARAPRGSAGLLVTRHPRQGPDGSPALEAGAPPPAPPRPEPQIPAGNRGGARRPGAERPGGLPRGSRSPGVGGPVAGGGRPRAAPPLAAGARPAPRPAPSFPAAPTPSPGSSTQTFRAARSLLRARRLPLRPGSFRTFRSAPSPRPPSPGPPLRSLGPGGAARPERPREIGPGSGCPVGSGPEPRATSTIASNSWNASSSPGEAREDGPEGLDKGLDNDAEGVWSPDIEQSFQEALAIYPPCGRRKIILSDEGKMYGRNELIARYIKLRTGKTRTRKQVSSHIQVLARKKVREYQVGIKAMNLDQVSKDKALQSMASMSSAQIVSASVLQNKFSPPSPLPQAVFSASSRFWSSPPLLGQQPGPSQDIKPFAQPTYPVQPPLPPTLSNYEPLAPLPSAAASVPVWQDRTIASSRLRLLEYSAFMEVQRDPDTYSKHLFVHIGQTNPAFSDPPLEAVDVRQIYDKFPEKKGGLKELYEKGPPNAFFLVKFWADLNSTIQEGPGAFYGVSSQYSSADSMTISVSTKVCSFGKQVVEKVETEYARLENGRFVYRIHRSPMCEYMINFIHKLKHLPEKYMMNSVLENFTVLQVVTSRDSQETLLVIAFVFEVSTSEHGAQHHVYKLVKD
ncbi:transcriptional enhancer factor TEF-5 [Bos indicus x Bos taurus]|nr:transcriptional enhancer factor TEF-5 [Bos indicus x Bos taurus]